MKIRTFRLGAGSVIALTVPNLDDPERISSTVAAFGTLGVSVVVVHPDVEVDILTGPGHPIEIGPATVVR